MVFAIVLAFMLGLLVAMAAISIYEHRWEGSCWDCRFGRQVHARREFRAAQRAAARSVASTASERGSSS